MKERMEQLLRERMEKNQQVQRAWVSSPLLTDLFVTMTEGIASSMKQGGRLYVAGNGGSAADSQHLVAELMVKIKSPRRPLPAEALSVDSSLLTSIGNDFDFSEVFARQLEGKMSSRDVFLALSTSGNSPNILKALEFCRRKDWVGYLWTGSTGGKGKGIAKVTLSVPSDDTSTIQEMHTLLYHALCMGLEQELC